MSRHLAVSLGFAALAVAGAELQHRSPFALTADVTWLDLALGLGLGALLAAITLGASRWLLRSGERVERGEVDDLRPWVREWVDHLGAGLAPSTGAAVVSAGVAAISEELFFRGLVLPLTGTLVSSLLFGAVHLVGGGSARARWTWALAAFALALALGAIVQLTGSLAGALLAHVLINVINVPRIRTAYAGSRARAGELGQIGRRSGGRPLGGLLRGKV